MRAGNERIESVEEERRYEKKYSNLDQMYACVETCTHTRKNPRGEKRTVRRKKLT